VWQFFVLFSTAITTMMEVVALAAMRGTIVFITILFIYFLSPVPVVVLVVYFTFASNIGHPLTYSINIWTENAIDVPQHWKDEYR
jgi:hypothetical protein